MFPSLIPTMMSRGRGLVPSSTQTRPGRGFDDRTTGDHDPGGEDSGPKEGAGVPGVDALAGAGSAYAPFAAGYFASTLSAGRNISAALGTVSTSFACAKMTATSALKPGSRLSSVLATESVPG